MVKENVVYIYTLEYFSTLTRGEILTCAAVWLNLEDVMLSKISHTPKDKSCMIHLYERARIGRFLETNRVVVVRVRRMRG